MSRGPDSGTRLAHALEAAGPGVVVSCRSATRWASATFAGARHEMTIDAPACDALDAWLAALPEAEIAIRGHLVADLTVVGFSQREDRATIVIEALTVED